MLKKITLIAMALVLLTQLQAFATENTSITKGDDPYKTSECSAGGASDQFFCFQKKLFILEDEMHADIDKAKNDVIGEYDQTTEIQEKKDRIQESQDAWLRYRNLMCMNRYYTKAPIHSPSLSLEITACKYDKTKARIEEIKKTYFKKKEDK